MKVFRVDLLEREITPDNRCVGKVRICLDTGASIVLDCSIPYRGVGGTAGLNGSFAQEALRQLRRLPEYSETELQIAKHAMPRQTEKALWPSIF